MQRPSPKPSLPNVPRLPLPAEAPRGPDKPQQHAAAAIARQLNKTQGLLSVYRTLSKLDPNHSKIERRGPMPPTSFLREFYAANRPVILTGLMKNWKAMSRWSPDYLKQTLAGEMIQIRANDPGANGSSGEAARKEIPFEQFADQILQTGAANGSCFLAHPGFLKRPRVQPLLEDVLVPGKYLNPQAVTEGTCLAVEPAGFTTPLRHELANVMLAQVYGRKTIKLVPSHDIDLVYAGAAESAR